MRGYVARSDRAAMANSGLLNSLLPGEMGVEELDDVPRYVLVHPCTIHSSGIAAKLGRKHAADEPSALRHVREMPDRPFDFLGAGNLPGERH
jgi:hypothetical protein